MQGNQFGQKENRIIYEFPENSKELYKYTHTDLYNFN